VVHSSVSVSYVSLCRHVTTSSTAVDVAAPHSDFTLGVLIICSLNAVSLMLPTVST